jgi:glutamyl-tRNA reductase
VPAAIAASDLVISCTGATGQVLSRAAVADAQRMRGSAPLVLLDLALPRDVETAAGQLPGVRLIDLEAIGASRAEAADAGLAALASDADVTAVRRIVAQELAGYLKAKRAESVAPTVVALRAKAATVVESELVRLDRRLGDLDARTRREIAQAMGRIADKLLHGPTVRVKELAGSPGGDSYETAVRVLFELDPETVQAVQQPDDDMLAWTLREAAE